MIVVNRAISGIHARTGNYRELRCAQGIDGVNESEDASVLSRRATRIKGIKVDACHDRRSVLRNLRQQKEPAATRT
jgi:hypothetical protein